MKNFKINRKQFNNSWFLQNRVKFKYKLSVAYIYPYVFFKIDFEMSINYIFYTLMESRRFYGKSVADAEQFGLHFLRIFSLICYIEHRQERWAINSSRLSKK